ETMRVVEASRFASAFTFQYSIRQGTPAATMEDQVPKSVVQERYERLIALQERISLEENQKQLGRSLEVLVSTGEGKKDVTTRRLTGRAEDN
ncbi:tRNA (N6-isopentenyl adenosine(37)-C2)-methylthiotransferase MiaB, partial [Acinetobacter baumannii]